MSYVKTELVAFPFVTDRFQSDIEIFILSRRAPNGGSLFNINLIGWQNFESVKDTFQISTYSFDTEDDRRNKVLKAIQLLLVKNLSIDLVYQYYGGMKFLPPDSSMMSNDFDPWNYFIYNIGSGVNVNGESNRTSLSVWNWASLNRIRNESKITAWVQFNYNRNEFLLSGKPIIAYTQRIDSRLYYAKSLNQHWSVGLVGQFYQDVFTNIDYAFRSAPVVEYNIFPFREAMRRQFRFAYQAGGLYNNYMKETVFDVSEELRPYQRLSIIVDITQPWGTVRSLAYATNFIDNWLQNRLTWSNSVRLRLVKGLSAAFIGNASAINDQISLAKTNLNQEQVLLRAQQLPTSYTFESYVELNYTFGSINNSIINPRFNQID